jgi:hypothetical protein
MGQLASKESELYLKSYLELESKSESIFEFKRESYKLFEWTHYKNLKKGQTYFARFECYEIEGIFKSYYVFHRECDYCHNCDAIIIDNKNSYTIDIHWQFYRVVSEKEYMERVRAKYNETVLNIILKRLVNEEFTW